ncbi:fibroblast growth factor 1 [Paramuricea clavata]|uniref:Fibroblast growth factor 1 n=1 Tax=Paramuricea clavata TaxID=317549 RepID=A0A6S7KIM9_PARCT|nr:fibroblast growth factor 1 [Paramuricea clavata]
MSTIKARLVNRHGYYLEVQSNGTITSNVKGDSLYGILEFQTTNFGEMTIKGKETSLYIYVKPDGSLATTKTNNTGTNTLSWAEQKTKQMFSTFSSVSIGNYLSIRNNGKVKTAKKSSAQLGRSEMWFVQTV